MDLTIRSTIDGREASIIRDGSIIIEYGASFWVEIENLKFQFKFEDYKEGEKLIKVSAPPASENGGHMEILIRVNESSIDSVFLSPAEIGSFTENDQTYSLGLSFAVRKLIGSNNSCIQFIYTFFLSQCPTPATTPTD